MTSRTTPPQDSQEGEHELKQMIDHVPAMVYSFTTDENNENPRFPRVSNGAELVYGVTAEAVMADAMALIGRIHPDDVTSFVESVATSWKELSVWQWTGRSLMDELLEDGDVNKWRWIRCRSTPTRLPNGHTIWYGSVFNVDAEIKLENSEAELTALIATANAPIFKVDAESVVTVCNAKAASLLGVHEAGGAELVGKRLMERVAAEAHEAVQGVLDRALAGESTLSYELPMQSADGTTVEVLLNATPQKDSSGKIVGVVGVGQDMTEFRAQQTEKEGLRATKHAQRLKYSHAFDRLSDVIFAVRAASWEADWHVYESTKSYGDYFRTDDVAGACFLDVVDDRAAFLALLAAVRADGQKAAAKGSGSSSSSADGHGGSASRDIVVVCPSRSSEARTLRCRAIDISGLEGFLSVLIVCHDLTDFKFRIETEKDRQVAAKLQHEDKNGHKAQEINAAHAIEQLDIVEGQMQALRRAADLFESPELQRVWLEMETVRERSYEAVAQARRAMASVVKRALQAQEESHLRVIMYQLSANEYVPVRNRTDVVGRLHDELQGTSTKLRAFEVPEVLLDWSLFRYALDNALSNARKYGTHGTAVEVAVEYREPTLSLVVSNGADPAKQARLIARHGTDVTRMLHRRGDSEGIQSTNLGGQALRDCARVLHGSVQLQLLPASTRLVLEVEAPRPAVEAPMGSAAQQQHLVWFIDDEPTMRMVYETWVQPPSPLSAASRIFPPPGLSKEQMDASMRGFADAVLAAIPRPTAVVLDQNLRSQVVRRENATTGSAIAAQLRAAGYDGMIFIRSANVSAKVVQEYLAAGADCAMSKDESRDAFMRRLTEFDRAGAPPWETSNVALLAGEGEAMWATLGDAEQRASILAEFRQGAVATMAELLALLEARDVGALPDELHYLLGQCRTVGAWRMQEAVGACKAAFGYVELARLHELLAQTFAAMDERCGADHASTAEQKQRAADMALLAQPSRDLGSSSRAGAAGQGSRSSRLDNAAAFPVSGALSQPQHNPSSSSDGSSSFKRSQRARPLFVAGIDDAPFARRTQEALLFSALGADMQCSRAIGETKEEQLAFISFALGKADKELQPLPPPYRQADVAVLDQHIVLDGKPHLLGTELARDLRAAGFLGVICIVSGEARSDFVRTELAALPPVDVFSLKSFEPSTLAEKLLGVHHRRSRQLERALPLQPASGRGPRADTAAAGAALTVEAAEAAEAAEAPADGGPALPSERDDSPKEPNLAELIDLSHWDGIPTEVQRDLLAMAYTKERTLYKYLDDVAVSLDDPDRLRHAAHTLYGVAQTAGAQRLAVEVQAFKAAPSVEGMATLRRILGLTHRQLQASKLVL